MKKDKAQFFPSISGNTLVRDNKGPLESFSLLYEGSQRSLEESDGQRLRAHPPCADLDHSGVIKRAYNLNIGTTGSNFGLIEITRECDILCCNKKNYQIEVRGPSSLVATLSGHNHPITLVRDFVDHVVTCDSNQTIIVWQKDHWKMMQKFNAAASPIVDMIACVGKLYTLQRNGCLKCWDILSGECQETNFNRPSFCGLEHQNNETLLVFEYHPKKFQIHQVNLANLELTLKKEIELSVDFNFDTLMRVFYNPEHQSVIFACRDSTGPNTTKWGNLKPKPQGGINITYAGQDHNNKIRLLMNTEGQKLSEKRTIHSIDSNILANGAALFWINLKSTDQSELMIQVRQYHTRDELKKTKPYWTGMASTSGTF